MNTKMTKFILSMLIALGCLTLSVSAQAKTLLDDYLSEKGVEIEVSASMDFYNKYVWRGFLLDDDMVLQPGVTISSNGFEGGFWGSWDLQGEDALDSNEVDGWIGYSFDAGFLGESFEKLSFSVGNTWYDFPTADLYTMEYYIGIAVDTFLSPYLTWVVDYGDEDQGGADGNYIMGGIGHSFTLNEDYGIALELGLEGGYNDNAFIDGIGGYVLSNVALALPLTENLTVSPTVAYSVPLGDLADVQKEQVYSGVSLAFSF